MLEVSSLLAEMYLGKQSFYLFSFLGFKMKKRRAEIFLNFFLIFLFPFCSGFYFSFFFVLYYYDLKAYHIHVQANMKFLLQALLRT